ncbi:MAG: polyamine-transporting ATPase [Pseudomonadota bacterium]|nr:ABC transporter ATP-binding protein [Rubrivivax sp.]
MSRLLLQGLAKRFGGVQALAAMDLDIAQGELISLLGPSGCGKTTTLRCVAGFEQPDEGRITFDGQDVTALPPDKRDIGMVFQNYALFPHMTVAQNLAFGLEMRRVPRETARVRIEQALKMVQLSALPDRLPRQLSGGQQQRVALARALVIEPRVLLLDEPLANLDAALREEMRFFIRDLQQRVRITTLYVTHDQSEAMVMSDRVVVMFDGRIAQLGVPEDIYARPRTRRVASFIGRANFVEGTVERALDARTALLRTGLGPVAARCAAVPAAGTRAAAAIRPEAITLSAAAPPGAALPAGAALVGCTVEKTYFLGGAVDHVLRCADGTSLLAQTAPARSVAAGGTAHLVLDPEQAWLLPDEAAAAPAAR